MIKPWRLSRLPTSWSRPQSFSLPPSSTSFSGRTGLPWTAIPSKTRKSASTRCSAAPTCQIDCPDRTKFGENLHIHLSENATQIKSKTKNLKFKLWQKHSLKKSQIILFSSIIMMLNVLCKMYLVLCLTEMTTIYSLIIYRYLVTRIALVDPLQHLHPNLNSNNKKQTLTHLLQL